MSRRIVVVGGGVMGLCAALELARSGADVTVLDAAPKGVGTSMGNAGMLVPSHVIPLSAPGVVAQGLRWMLRRDSPFHLKPRLSYSLATWLLRFWSHCTAAHVRYAVPILRDLSLTSMALFDELADERDDFALANTGLMMVYRTAALHEAMMHEADVAEEAGLFVRRLDADALRKTEPNLRSEAAGAILFEQDGRIDPDAFMGSLERRLAEAGVIVRHRERVTDVRAGTVRTDADDYRFDDLVLAAGAWTTDLARRVGARLPMEPAKGYSVTLPAPDDGPSIPMILMDTRVTITPMPGKLRFGGTLSLSGFDASVDRSRVRPILDQARLYSPDADVDDLPVWRGFRPASPDGLPMIGRVKDGVYALTGHGMMGISLAPASARLLADMVLGRTPILDPAPFDPLRF